MTRREMLRLLAAALPAAVRGESKADFTLRIGPVAIEPAPRHIVKTTGYNGTSPGPMLRMREGQSVSIDVINDTAAPNIVHWHGLTVPPAVDGSMEEGTPMVPAHGQRRYSFIAAPAGTRWYHTHVAAGRNFNRGTYTGQFGFLYIQPRNDAGRYDQEVFLALKEWDGYLTTAGSDEGIDVGYKYFSINEHALGHGEPIHVKQGQRVLFHILNASATRHHRIGLSGHVFEVVTLDGNPIAVPAKTDALELGPAERIDAVVEMNQPGVWVLGESNDHDRMSGMGIVIEYANQSGTPRWSPPTQRWDYTVFGNSPAKQDEPAERLPLVFEKKFAGSRWMDEWTINGKMFPKTDPIRVRENQRYRLVFDNRSNEAHPVHLHRHTFELTSFAGKPTSGVRKDVVVVPAKARVEADLVANNPGLTLFHCHQQMHMDYGFMCLLEYV